MSKRIDIQPATIKKQLAEHPLRVAAYCRVSTDHEEQLGSLENQMKFYTDYIRNQINWTLAGIYSDNVSGVRIKKRPGYQQMMKDCKYGKIDLILTKSISRFGRDTLTTIKDIRRLKKMNIGVYFEVGGFNTLTTSDSIIDRMLSNEKYVGQVLMQKTYTPDFLTGRQVKNKGQLAMYLVEDAHEPIIDREMFDKVQQMKGRIKTQGQFKGSDTEDTQMMFL